MKLEKKLEDLARKQAIMKDWPGRIKKAMAKGVLQKVLCIDAKMDPSNFDRLKRGKVADPAWDTIKRVEKALKKAGV